MKDHDEIQFFNPWGEVDFSKNRLPHWQQTGGCYFITWRQADSIPQEKLDRHFYERSEWLRNNPEPWDNVTEAEYHRLFSTQLEEWMDAAYGSCLLRDRDNASYVKDALLYFEGERTSMLSFVIMPNHVHTLFILNPGYELSKIVQSWKGVSARKVNLQAELTGHTLWQKDYFDRLVRNQKHFESCVRYIRRNPEKAHLGSDEFYLYESEVAKRVI